MSTPIQPLTLLVFAIAGWIQREQQAAIVYLLEENKVLKARLRGRKLRLTDDERRRLVHFNVTEHPSAEWTAQQMVNAFPRRPRLVIGYGIATRSTAGTSAGASPASASLRS